MTNAKAEAPMETPTLMEINPLEWLINPLEWSSNGSSNPNGNQPIRMTNAKAEAPILWSPGTKSQLIGKYPDATKNWGQEKKG